MSKLKDLLTYKMPKNDTASASMQILAGGYVIYLAISMVNDTMKGVSEMSMTITVITAVIMALFGVGFIVYAIRTLKRVEREEKAKQAQKAAELAEGNAEEEQL